MTAFRHPQEQNNQQQTANNKSSSNQTTKNQTSENKERKSLFGSKTFWGVVFTSAAAVAPIVGKDIDKTLKGEPVNYGEDAAQVVVIVCGAAASIIGRVDAKSPVYTPKWMPGPNSNDFKPERFK